MTTKEEAKKGIHTKARKQKKEKVVTAVAVETYIIHTSNV
jgi:hypothetical protein